jgi:hypothetical protein
MMGKLDGKIAFVTGASVVSLKYSRRRKLLLRPVTRQLASELTSPNRILRYIVKQNYGKTRR